MANLKGVQVSSSVKKRLVKKGLNIAVNAAIKKALKGRKSRKGAVAGTKGSKAKAANVPSVTVKKGLFGRKG